MGASCIHRQGVLGLVVFCCLLLQLCSAQNYTALRNGVWLPPECQVEPDRVVRELQSLQSKLSQIQGTRADQQLQFLSPSSRSKLNNLTGNAAEWLRNQTSAQLEELFEGIRAQNFRRMMAIASIASQLRGAFTSSNVLRSLEQLQTEDLERIASLPLFEERYQRLTNVTFLELLQQLYNFGLTQVPQRTCVQTAANTSDISRLPGSTATAPSSSFSAINTEPNKSPPVVTYSIMANTGRKHKHSRRSLLSVFSGPALSWMHLDHSEAAAAVVRAVTTGPGSSGSTMRRVLLQTPVQPAATDDKTVAPIVINFLDRLGATNPDGTPVSPTTSQTSSGITSIGTAGGVPGISTVPGFLDARAVSSGCTENLGLYRLRSTERTSIGSSGGLSGRTSGSRSGGSSGSGSSRGSTSSGTATGRQGVNSNALALPCPLGTVQQGGICVCVNGTTFNATLSACVPAPCVNLNNKTQADGITPCIFPPAPIPPCINGSLPNGTLCTPPPPPPCVNGTLPDGVTPCPLLTPPPPPCINGTLPNGTQCTPPPSLGAPPPPPCVNGTLPDGITPCNATLPPPPMAPGGINGTAFNGTDPSAFNYNGTAPPNWPSLNGTQGPNWGANFTPPAADGNGTYPPGVPPPPPAGLNGTVDPRIGGVVGGDNGTVIPPPPYYNTTVGGVPPPLPPGVDANGSWGVQQPPVVQPPPAVINSSGGGLVGGGGYGDAYGNVTQPYVPPVASPPGYVPGVSVNQSTGGYLVPPPPGAVATASPAPAVVDPTAAASPAPYVAAAPSPAPSTGGTIAPPEVFSPGGLVTTPATQQPSPAPAVVGGIVQTPPAASPAIIGGDVQPTVPVPSPAVVAPPTTGVTVIPPTPVVVSSPSVGVYVPPTPPPTVAVASPAPTAPVIAPPIAEVIVPPHTVSVPVPSTAPAVQTPVPPLATAPVAPVTIIPPEATPVNCVGSWVESGICNAPCEGTGTKTSVFTVTTPAANGGAACEAAAGATKEVACTSVVACPKAAPVACVGSWAETGACNAPCEGTGTKTSTFTVITPAANGGAACEAASGATKQVPCTSLVACPKAAPVACVGSWAETGTCDAPCEGTGTKTSTFTVITPAANGGAACEAASGATKQVPCSNPTACPKPPVACVGSWAETGTCNAPCEGTGTKTSVFTVTTPAANGGATCEAASGATKQVPCSNPTACPKPPPPAPTATPTPATAPVAVAPKAVAP